MHRKSNFCPGSNFRMNEIDWWRGAKTNSLMMKIKRAFLFVQSENSFPSEQSHNYVFATVFSFTLSLSLFPLPSLSLSLSFTVSLFLTFQLGMAATFYGHSLWLSAHFILFAISLSLSFTYSLFHLFSLSPLSSSMMNHNSVLCRRNHFSASVCHTEPGKIKQEALALLDTFYVQDNLHR